MPEKTKQKKDSRPPAEKETYESSGEKASSGEQGNWGEDQRKKSYYYDDAYGYEIYDPDKEEEDES